MSGGFGAGFIKGTLVSLVAAAALSLSAPLSPLDPGSKTQVDLATPAGSGFNAERKDSNPVLPDTDQTVVTEDIRKPEISEESGAAPLADTASATQPTASQGVAMPAVDPGVQGATVVTPSPDKTTTIAPVALGVPMPEIDNPLTEIPVNRLPVIEAPVTEVAPPPLVDETGSLAQTSQATEVATAGATDAGPATEPPLGASALMQNRVAFDNPDGKPLVSVILIDVGDAGLGTNVLETFSFRVTFAIAPDSKGATALAKKLSHKGFEILALAPRGDGQLTKEQSPEAIDTALGNVFATLPEAVGLLDALPADIQKTPALADEVIGALIKTGHGFLSYDIGLNTTDHKAQRRGLKSGIVYRVLDEERESGSVIKRYLDRAALEARKTGQVIVVGRTYPETVTALYSWALSAKSSTIALAPVSAALLSRK